MQADDGAMECLSYQPLEGPFIRAVHYPPYSLAFRTAPPGYYCGPHLQNRAERGAASKARRIGRACDLVQRINYPGLRRRERHTDLDASVKRGVE